MTAGDVTPPITPTFTPVADHGLLVEFATEISDATTGAVFALDAALSATPVEGLREVVPALVNLLVVFDPLLTDHSAVEAVVRRLLPSDAGETAAFDRHHVMVCYDEDLGTDLAGVAAACDTSVDAVIAAHLAGDYRVLMYGFAPGYAYMAGVPEVIHVPRKPAAVRGIPAGRVIITGPQCLITTIEMPTGWSIIGSSPANVLRSDPDHPFLFDVGDHVTFERIDRTTHDRMWERR